ncbi:MAG: DinB family protein [Chloroflexi bacterium]|nr:DinB family protein [Chloroflexota bacterium]
MYRSKAEWLRAKERAYSEFQAVVEEIGDAGTAKIKETATGEWGLEDVVAHVAFWEDFLSKMLIAWLVEGTPFPGFESYDEINAYSTALRRSGQLSNILQELERAHRDVMTIVKDLTTDETLHREVPVAYASRVDQRPLGEVLSTYIEHYAEHAEQLRSLS